MKRPFLVLLALAASAGFATWLVRTPHELREILTACGAWVLGFWAAAAIQSRGGRRRKPRRRDTDRALREEDPDEDWEEDEEEDWEEDEEEQDGVGEDDAWDERDR